MDQMLTLTHATERDVDLLLVEELRCSAAFVRWLVSQVAANTNASFRYETSEVTHSKRRLHNRREIDICVTLKGQSNLPIFLLVENKLDTSEQVNQAESYQAEAKLLVADGLAQAAYTILICPNAYAREHATFVSKFDLNVSYEAIIDRLAARADEPGELGLRLRHRREMLEQAVTKARRGYEAVPLPIIERFNSKYFALAAQSFPMLTLGPSMLREGRPGESKTMIFAPSTLPDWEFLPQMRIVHQLREGNVNVNFYTWGDHFNVLAATVAADLARTPYRPVPANNKRTNGRSGLMIVVGTPPIDNETGFDAQRESILAGLKATEELHGWIWSHRSVVDRWAAIVAAHR